MTKENDFLKKIIDLKAEYLFRDRSELIEEIDKFQIRCEVSGVPFEANETHVAYFTRDDEPTNSSVFGKELHFSFFILLNSLSLPPIFIPAGLPI